jgi:hypothetical protein
MDKQEWEEPDVMEAILKKAPELPHLKPLLVRFFEKALVTWERFTSEFAPGGVIDLATASEKDQAWMPPTNDVNEGALGSYRLFIRRKPTTSIHLYNVMAMCSRNGTEDFMLQNFQEEDYEHIRKVARFVDGQGLAKKQRKNITEQNQNAVQVKRDREAKAKQRQDDRIQHLTTVTQVTNVDDIGSHMTNSLLDEQLEIYRRLVDGVPLASKVKAKPDKIIALKQAITSYMNKHPELPSSSRDTAPLVEQQLTLVPMPPPIVHVIDMKKIKKMMNKQLDEQLDIYRKLVTGIPMAGSEEIRLKINKVKTLEVAISQYNEKGIDPNDGHSSEGEQFDPVSSGSEEE